jgi:hypothetical protein
LAIKYGIKFIPKTGIPIFAGIKEEALGMSDASRQNAAESSVEAKRALRNRRLAYFREPVMIKRAF